MHTDFEQQGVVDSGKHCIKILKSIVEEIIQDILFNNKEVIFWKYCNANI